MSTMRTNANLRTLLDGMGCHAPIRFARLRFPRAEGLCIPAIGIFIDEKYQSKAIPELYLQAVVYHEVGHWRDPVAWASMAVPPILFAMLAGLVFAVGNLALTVDYLWGIYALMVSGYFVSRWKERRADAYARRCMANYDTYNRPFTPDLEA